MNELSTPPVASHGEAQNLADLPARNARSEPTRIVASRRLGDGWEDVTAHGFAAEVDALAKGLVAAGIEPGDRVGIMSRTRYEWTLLDFAIWTAGAVPVPVYDTSSPHQISWIAQDSGMRGLVVETLEHARALAEVRDDLPALREVWQIDSGGLEDLVAAGREVSDEALRTRRGSRARSDTATIIYTSGTTGRPKGCVLTHDNFLALSENTIPQLPEVVGVPGASTLLFLPLAHVLARLIQVLCVDAMVRIGHAPSITTLMEDLKSFSPTFLLVVPRVFEKIYNVTDQRSAAEGKGRIFRRAAKVAITYGRALDDGRPSAWLRLQHRLYDALVYSKLRQAMGGKVSWAVCGGAPLGERLGHFYRGVGVHVLEGYGLTETTAPVSVNLPSMTRIGTVGPPLPGTSVRIADDGEVLVKGVGVFGRYHDNPEASAEAFTSDGWFRTGDVGSVADGFLRITGRKKEIIVTAGGKNVAPAPLEDVVRAHPLVSQCVVVGDKRPFVGALLTIDEEMLPTWAKAHDREGLTLQAALTDEYVHQHLQKAIDSANSHVSKAESIRAFTLLPADLTEATGHLTPSLKVKRDVVAADFAADIDALYTRPKPA